MNIKSGGRERTRELVRARDNWTCQDCGFRKGLEEILRHNLFHKDLKGKMKSLDVHHLNGQCGLMTKKYDSTKDISGLVTLCHKCHYNRPEHKCQSKEWQESINRVGNFTRKVHQESYPDIFSLRSQGLTLETIGKKFNVSRERIRQIIKDYKPVVLT